MGCLYVKTICLEDLPPSNISFFKEMRKNKLIQKTKKYKRVLNKNKNRKILFINNKLIDDIIFYEEETFSSNSVSIKDFSMILDSQFTNSNNSFETIDLMS